jgi:hypothetical protein
MRESDTANTFPNRTLKNEEEGNVAITLSPDMITQ